jgi:hypothetical protein
MWRPLPTNTLGLMNIIDGVIGAAASSLPNLRSSDSLLCASDYSGQHKESAFEAYSFVIAGSASWGLWEKRRLELRSGDLQSRRMSFKALSDGAKRRAVPAFLDAADHLDGLVTVFLVDKRIGSLFSKHPRFDFSELPEYENYGAHVFERLLRVVHFLSLLIGGLSSEKQNIYWFTDADDIAANHNRVRVLVDIFARVSGHYISHNLGHFRCGTAEDCDNGSRQVEDLCAIADLAAGAAASLVNGYRDTNTMPASELIVPAPATLAPKAAFIGKWLSLDSKLKRLVLALERDGESTAIRVKRLALHSVSAVG